MKCLRENLNHLLLDQYHPKTLIFDHRIEIYGVSDIPKTWHVFPNWDKNGVTRKISSGLPVDIAKTGSYQKLFSFSVMKCLWKKSFSFWLNFINRWHLCLRVPGKKCWFKCSERRAWVALHNWDKKISSRKLPIYCWTSQFRVVIEQSSIF